MKLKEFTINEEALDLTNVDFSDVFLIPIKSPWNTYLEVTQSRQIKSLTLCVWADISEATILVEVGEELIPIPKDLSIEEKNMLKTLLEI